MVKWVGKNYQISHGNCCSSCVVPKKTHGNGGIEANRFSFPRLPMYRFRSHVEIRSLKTPEAADVAGSSEEAGVEFYHGFFLATGNNLQYFSLNSHFLL